MGIAEFMGGAEYVTFGVDTTVYPKSYRCWTVQPTSGSLKVKMPEVNVPVGANILVLWNSSNIDVGLADHDGSAISSSDLTAGDYAFISYTGGRNFIVQHVNIP